MTPVPGAKRLRWRPRAAGLTVLGVLVAAGPAQGGSPGRFENPALGFEITRPDHWHFASRQAGTAPSPRSRQPEAVARFLSRHPRGALVTITRHREPYPAPNPTVQVALRPLGAFAGADPKMLMAGLTAPLEQSLKGFRVTRPAADVTIAGLPAVHMAFSYLPRNAPHTRVGNDLWVVPRGDYYFLVGAAVPPRDAARTRQDVRRMVGSIGIRPAPASPH
ncbi:MAG TPA: hypothetical protein VKA14_10165, partial [Gammaproteobacteria bacterium]|nr:hypothetical protein [Gammaproteobacteria bacterium]